MTHGYQSLAIAMSIVALGSAVAACDGAISDLRALAVPAQRSVVTSPARSSVRVPATKEELVSAALDELYGASRARCVRVFVSLDDLMAACPDIAAAARAEAQQRSRRAMSLPTAALGGAPWSTECQTVIAVHGDAPLPGPECSGGFIQLDDVAVHFSADGRQYQVTLRAPYLCGGQVYGHVDAPVDRDPPRG